MKKIVLACLLVGLSTGCSITLSGIPPIPEVIELPDGSFKVFVSHQSKTQVVRTSIGFMNKTCEDKNMQYRIVSETIDMTGEVVSEEYSESSFEILGIRKVDSEYKPVHMHEGEFHFVCEDIQSLTSR